ncbi:MAG: GTPase Era [Spirochaetia bacterium]
MKSAFVAVVGRPSSGKSTLLNSITGRKVSITASVPQTTRNKVRGIYTEERGQLVFIDTPGFHLSEKKFNLHMTGLVASSLEEIDLVLYVTDAGRVPGPEEEELARMIAPYADKTVAAVNKTDLPDAGPAELRAFIVARLPDAKITELSALRGEGVRDVVDALFELAPEGEQMYPEEFYTDQEPSFRISEIIREKAIQRVKQELPHSLYVEIADMEEQNGGKRLWIRAFLVVERESQKGILVGKGGGMIKSIRQEAQREIAELFPYRIHLDLRVKVNYKWRRKDRLLDRMFR